MCFRSVQLRGKPRGQRSPGPHRRPHGPETGGPGSGWPNLAPLLGFWVEPSSPRRTLTRTLAPSRSGSFRPWFTTTRPPRRRLGAGPCGSGSDTDLPVRDRACAALYLQRALTGADHSCDWWADVPNGDGSVGGFLHQPVRHRRGEMSGRCVCDQPAVAFAFAGPFQPRSGRNGTGLRLRTSVVCVFGAEENRTRTAAM